MGMRDGIGFAISLLAWLPVIIAVAFLAGVLVGWFFL